MLALFQFNSVIPQSGMILFGSLFFQFVSRLVCDNVLSISEFNAVCQSLIHELFNMKFFINGTGRDFMDWDSYFVFNPRNLRLKFGVGIYDGI